jgi:hypothetical protein
MLAFTGDPDTASDVVAEFPAATLLVVRDGELLATVTLIYIDSEDFWIPSTGEICVGSGIMGA